MVPNVVQMRRYADICGSLGKKMKKKEEFTD
jgi:hypothetical protein